MLLIYFLLAKYCKKNYKLFLVRNFIIINKIVLKKYRKIIIIKFQNQDKDKIVQKDKVRTNKKKNHQKYNKKLQFQMSKVLNN